MKRWGGLVLLGLLTSCLWEQILGAPAAVDIRGHFKTDLTFTTGNVTTEYRTSGLYKRYETENGKITRGTLGTYTYRPNALALSRSVTGYYVPSTEEWYSLSTDHPPVITSRVFITPETPREIYEKKEDHWVFTETRITPDRNLPGPIRRTKEETIKAYRFSGSEFRFFTTIRSTPPGEPTRILYEQRKTGIITNPKTRAFTKGDLRTVHYRETVNQRRIYDTEREEMSPWLNSPDLAEDQRTFRHLGSFMVLDNLSDAVTPD